MIQKLTNEKVFEIAYLLKSKYIDLSKYDKRFNFAVTRNLAILQPIASDILKARESNVEGFKEFESKKEEIVKKYSSDGGNTFISEEEKQKCQEEILSIVKDYTSAIEERQKEIKIFNEILSQEVELDIVQCSFNAVPEDFDFNICRIMIKETDKEIEVML